MIDAMSSGLNSFQVPHRHRASPSRIDTRTRYNADAHVCSVEDLLLSQGYKICPICGTHSHRNAAICSTCGTSLTDVEVVAETAKPSNGKKRYDRRYGETDLLEGELHRRSEVYIFGGLLVLLAVACVGAVAFAGIRWIFPGAAPTLTMTTLRRLTTCGCTYYQYAHALPCHGNRDPSPADGEQHTNSWPLHA